MAGINDSVTQNLLPVQAYFNLDGTFNTFIGQNMPFYASINPVQSGLTITNSTIDSTVIGANSPAAGTFTSITTTTGTISTSPSGNTDITNKLYVDTVAQGLGPKAACQCGTLANITLSGLQTIDGYTTLAGDRVLVKNQTTQANNGIYIASANAWSRSADMDVWSEVSGAYTVVLNGSQAETGWVCTSPTTGTIGVTAITWVQFSTVNTYYAGTGLTLTANTFSITNVGTAGTYGSASAVPVLTTNAQGQVTSVTNTPISIANTQVTGLGTMSTQNANSVAITGGSINGTTIGGSTASAITGTTITATSSFSGSGSGLTGLASGLSIGGNAATATSATSAGSVTNSITFNSSGLGGASPVSYNGSTAPTISYNTIGAPSTTGTGASGNWGISITGNAATVTNGVYTTGSYSNPTWITSILGSIVSGAVASATSATNLSGGTAGALAYQSGSGATTFLTLGTTNYVLTAGASAPQYVAQSTLSVGSAATATSATTATNLAGGIASQIPYQSAAGATAFIANGTSGQFLQSNGTGAPTWATPTSYATVTDDTTTNGTRYPLFANQTSGNLSTEYTSSTKLQYNPSTGVFTSTSFSGAGTGLTGTASSLSIGGNAATATSATSATTSTNLAGGLAGYLPYQSAVNTTTFLAPGTNGYILTLSSGLPTWAAAPATGVTITDDTSSATAYYPLFARVTSGTVTTEYTSSTKLNYTPSTGLLAATSFSGAGTGLTGTASGLSIGGNAATATSATNVAGGTVGAIHYQSAAGVTAFLTGNTTTTPQFVTSTGTGSLAQAPTLTSSTGSGNVVLATSPTITTPVIDKINTSITNVSLGAGNSSIMKNRIINGAMVIDQRNSGGSVTPANSYTLDRWYAAVSQTGKFTVQQNAGSVTPPSGYKNYLGVTSSSAYSVLTGDYFGISQRIEGYNFADLMFGTASAQTFTFSFWVRSSLTGNFGGSFQGAATATLRSYPFSYTISSANTWEQKTIIVAGDTFTNTWDSTNGVGLYANFGLGAGTSASGTSGTWASANYANVTGATSVVGTSGATFYITGVQLEVGSSATGYEYRQYQQELALCQRYYFQQTVTDAFGQISFANITTTTNHRPWIPFPVNMRTTPTSLTYGSVGFITIWGSAVTGISALAIDRASTQGAELTATLSGALGTAGGMSVFLANNSATAFVGFPAEL